MKKQTTGSSVHGGKSPHRTRNIVITCLTCIVAVILVGITYVLYTVGQMKYTPLTKDPSALGVNTQISDKNITNIALFGLDQRSTENARSDAIMILSIDNRTKKVKLSSILRDSYVEIEGRGKDKINHAYAFGGPELAIKTINQNFGLDITDYVAVNFNQLVEVIDAIGGIEIEISEAERVSANGNMDEYASINNVAADYITSTGKIHVNGMQALAFSRIRNVGNGDYGRTDRQRYVLEQMFNKVMAMNVTSYPGLATKMMPLVQTSLSATDVISLGTKFIAGGKPTFEQARFPMNSEFANGGGSMINGVWYMVFDLDVTKDKLQKFIFQDIKPQ